MKHLRFIFVLLMLSFTALTLSSTSAVAGENGGETSATVIRTIVYRQLTDFPSSANIRFIGMLKMSSDGSRIAFTADFRRIYTMNADGSNLIQVFDYGFPVSDLRIDINGDGSKVVWTQFDAQNEIYVANFDGTNRLRIATDVANAVRRPSGANTPMGARITSDGNPIYFLHIGDGPDVAGGYRINADGSGLTRLFNYRDIARLFGRDGNDYIAATAFRGGFDISDSGLRMIFGTSNFRPAGNAITYDNVELKVLTSISGQLAIANGPVPGHMIISGDGRKVVVARSVFGEARDPVYSLNFDGTQQVEIIDHLSVIGGQVVVETTYDGSQVLSNARGITSISNTDGSGRLDVTYSAATCHLPIPSQVPTQGMTSMTDMTSPCLTTRGTLRSSRERLFPTRSGSAKSIRDPSVMRRSFPTSVSIRTGYSSTARPPRRSLRALRAGRVACATSASIRLRTTRTPTAPTRATCTTTARVAM
jgi:hypothetical protein